MRELQEKLQRNLPAGISVKELSMGMSGDFELLIAEGATLVRVGVYLLWRARHQTVLLAKLKENMSELWKKSRKLRTTLKGSLAVTLLTPPLRCGA